MPPGTSKVFKGVCYYHLAIVEIIQSFTLLIKAARGCPGVTVRARQAEARHRTTRAHVHAFGTALEEKGDVTSRFGGCVVS